MKTFKGCTLTQTETTTDVTRYAFGRAYQAVARVWGISGRLEKPAMQRPFLTSVEECREWIRGEDTLTQGRQTARLFEDVGGYYVCSDDSPTLDARGRAYRTKTAAVRAASAAGYRYVIGSGSPYGQGRRAIPAREHARNWATG